MLAQPLLHFYHYETRSRRFRRGSASTGFYIILVKGLTPIPYKIVTIASGAARMDFALFVAASVVTPGGRGSS